jgi:hypothetical protein
VVVVFNVETTRMSDIDVITTGPRQSRFGKIPKKGGPVSREEIYELAAKHEGLLKKYGRATILDYDKLDEILAALPNAVIRGRTRRHSAA